MSKTTRCNGAVLGDMMKEKKTVFFGVLVVFLFVLGVFLEEKKLIPWKGYEYKFLYNYDTLDVRIQNSYEDHGFMLLNDSIMVWGGNELLGTSNPIKEQKLKKKMDNIYGSSNNAPIFLFMSPPFRIVTYSNSPSSFTVIQNNDTLIFELRNDFKNE